MRRIVAGVIGSLLVAGLVAPAVLAASPATGVARVVVIVGPAGAATDRYRSEARQAAAIARRYTPDVTEIYSPDATWPAVKAALQGASLVIYMGHGNGWPSPYRNSLYPATQNGFGLNPTSGGGDYTHQYFGEAKIARSIQLAPDAVVLLNHLCYASGNSEPGLAEGSLTMARQRVDNFAAGFIKVGASAVVAEAYASPNHMVRAVLGGRGSIETAWRTAPGANGHRFGFESVRSPGYIAEMDPERRTSGFTRSIVLKKGLASADVLRNGRGNRNETAPATPEPVIPSLTTQGVSLSTPSIMGGTSAGRRVFYRIPFTVRDRDRLPARIQASVRWDPLDPAASATTGGVGAAPDFGLIAPERLGDVVAPQALDVTKTRMSLHLASPATPGRYRLTVMLHDAEGVAYDAATQAMVPAMIVRVTGDHDAGVVAPKQLDLEPGQAQQVTVWVANLGKAAWGRKAKAIDRPTDADLRQPDVSPESHARLTGTWLAPTGLDDPAQASAAAAAAVTPYELPAAMAPRAVHKVALVIYAPSTPGDYLLVLDIITPDAGALSAQGVDPTIVRVHVAAATAVASGAAPVLPGATGP